MVKNKNIRDYALVIFMLIVVVSFIVYQFIPTYNGSIKKEVKRVQINEKNMERDNTNKIANKDILQTEDIKPEINEENKEELIDKSDIYINNLELILIDAFDKMNNGFKDFEDIDMLDITNNITNLIIDLNEEQEKYKNVLSKVIKYDLLTLIKSYDEFEKIGNNKRDRIVLFISIFLKSVKENNLIQDLLSDKKLLHRYLSFDFYKIIDYEIEKAYEFIPILFYLKILLNHSQLFEKNDIFDNFVVKLEGLKDLTNTNFIQNLILKLHFVTERIKINIYWTEEDKLDPDDRGEYLGIDVKLYKNLGIEFLIFPDVLGENLWLKELINADNNAIELKYLWIEEESLDKTNSKITLFFNERLSKFFVIFGDINDLLRNLGNNFLDKLIHKRIQSLRNSMTEIVISKDYQSIELFKEFSDFLKKRISKVID